jgi:Family of unknown function (DUF6049)
VSRARRAIGAVALLFGALAPLAARPVPAPALDRALALVGQPAWTPLAGDATLLLDIPADGLPVGEDLTVRLRFHNALATSTAFDRTITGERLGNRIQTLNLPLASLPRDAGGAVNVTFGLTGSPTLPTVPIRTPGVYPLEVALVGEDVIEAFVTWLVVVDPAAPATDTAPVNVAWVWSVVAGPVLDADGVAYPLARAELIPGGRLDTVATLLATANGLPLSLRLGPETLEGWTTLAASEPVLAPGVQRVSAAAARPATQLLPLPYVPIDLPSLEHAGLGGELAGQRVAGSETLDALLGITPDPRTAFVEPVDSATLERLRNLLVDRVVVRASSVVDMDVEDALSPFEITFAGDSVPAAATSPRFELLLRGSAPPALRAQRLLAAMSLLAFERVSPAGVVLAPPVGWYPDLDAHRALITGLQANPLITAVTLDTLFESVPARTGETGPVVRELAPITPEPFPITGSEFGAANGELSALRSTLGAQDPAIARGERALDLALSSANTPAQAQADLDIVHDALDALDATIFTTERRVTLTARRADVPLSFENLSGKPVTVRVRLDSEKLLFPNGNEQTVELPVGTSTHPFAVEARASGTFTMSVTLTTGDGASIIGAPASVTVRSAAFSGIGAALTVGALLFLALWWGNHYRRARRARRAATA